METQFDDVASSTEIILPRTVKSRLQKFGKFRVLVVVTTLLFAACIALAVLLALSRKSAASKPMTSQKSFICDTEDCLYSAQDVINQINKTADPCEDFYEFACGGWMRRNPLTINESSVSGFTVLIDDNMKVLKSALENAPANYSKNAAVMKTAKFYQACLDTTSIAVKGAAPLQALIKQYGGWSLNGPYNTFSTTTLMGKVMRELDVDTFLGLSVSVDFEDNTKYILKLGPARLGMNYENYVKHSADNRRIRAAYKTYMKKVAKLLGGGVDSDSIMMKIYDFEEKLATIAEGKDPDLSLAESLEERRVSGKSLLGIDKTIRDFSLETQFPTSFILGLFNEAFAGMYDFNERDKILALPEWYFEKLGKYYSYDLWSDLKTLKDYIIWRVVDRYVLAMPSTFTDAKMEYINAVMGPRTSQRWSDCISEMMGPMDMPLGLLFVDSHFDENRKATVVEMTKRIRTAFIDNLKSAQWMDQYTKYGAKEKALAIKEDIGFPSWIKDRNKMANAYFELTVIEGNFFDSFKAVNTFTRIKNFKQLNMMSVNKDKWSLSPAVVNGYYALQQNRIVFLAGIIQPPFYIPTRPRYMNYGAIGMVIGHEITHGFDGEGRFFNADGNIENWWSPSSSWNFDQRSQCLVKQYSKFEVFGENVNGTQTLNENIADNGGIKLAYDAYQAWVHDNKPEGRLPGLGLSVDQLFFVGFARPWCSIYKREAALLQLRSDSHTFNKYRIIGSLSNFDKFSESYKCKKGSNMNPYKQCAVW